MNNVEHTNPSFYRSHGMKLYYLVYYKIMQTMYKVSADCVQRLFSIHECKYDVRCL